jgi:hypothetical protein
MDLECVFQFSLKLSSEIIVRSHKYPVNYARERSESVQLFMQVPYFSPILTKTRMRVTKTPQVSDLMKIRSTVLELLNSDE